MLQSPKFQHALKALLLIGLALFFYSRIANGTLNYYIAQRFAIFTLVAIVGLLLVGISYYNAQSKETDQDHEHDPDYHDHAAHEHALTWGGALLVALPIVLGLLVPPRPLGAAALANREVNVTAKGSTMPAALRAANQKSSLDKNILDWTQLFQSAPDAPTQFAGEPAKVIGFVFRDERFNDEQFLVTRFTVSCCAADGSVVGLVVKWPQAAKLPTDQWVEVTGVLSAGTLAGEAIPVLTAQSIDQVPVPNQPYLYP